MQPDDLEDIWTVSNVFPDKTTPNMSRTALHVETVHGVDPMDDQFGVDPKKTVPDALYYALFGQSEPTESEVVAAGGCLDNISPIQTYAILDAAKVLNLPEMLETSGLEHRCLFLGSAYDDLNQVAPWIVRLEDENSFTRNLFTRSTAPWHLWGQLPVIYVRTRAPLDVVWRHLRKFTTITTSKNARVFLRFWDVSCLEDLLYHDGALKKSIFCQKNPYFLSVGVCSDQIGFKEFVPLVRISGITATSDESLEQVFFNSQHHRRQLELENYLVSIAPKRFKVLGKKQTAVFRHLVLERARSLNITKYSDVAYLGVVMQCLGARFDLDASLPKISQIMLDKNLAHNPYRLEILQKEVALYFSNCHGDGQIVLFKRMQSILPKMATLNWMNIRRNDCYRLLHDDYPERLEYMGDQGFHGLWQQCCEAASQHGYEEEWHICVFFSFAVFLGLGFYIDPLYPWVRRYLVDLSKHQDQKLIDMANYGLRRAAKIVRLNCVNVV